MSLYVLLKIGKLNRELCSKQAEIVNLQRRCAELAKERGEFEQDLAKALAENAELREQLSMRKG